MTGFVYPFHSKPLVEVIQEHDIVAGLQNVLSNTSAEVWGREDESFHTSATIFNGAVKTFASAVVRPRDARHVSETVKFCREKGLQLSVKAGGTGVHGGSVAGHVILDLCLLNDISVDLVDTSLPLSETISSSYKRPSICTTSGESYKRSAEEDVDHPSRSRQRINSRDGSASSVSQHSGDSDTSTSWTNPNVIRNGSGSRSDSGSTSTPTTSTTSSDVPTLPPVPQPRMTYVNPTPTTTSAFPFVASSFGGAPSTSAVAMWNSFGPQRLVLNTNPDPPPHVIVTFGAGVRSKQLDAYTAASPYGAFHVPTSAFPVGSGQFLTGGFGFIGRKHGLAMDNLVEAELVLADGRIVWVGEDTHSGEWLPDEDPRDVWYALRGAGSMLGVVTRFRAKAYYLPSVYAGNLIYAFDRQTTPDLLRHLRDCIKGAPRTVYCNIIITAGPTDNSSIVAIQLCFSGSRSEGEVFVQAISSWDGGQSIFRDFSERTFERQQVAVEEILKGGAGRKWYIKSGMLNSLSDEVIEETCQRFAAVPDGCTWLFEYTGGGAVKDVKDSCWPLSHRESAFTVAALHQWGHFEPAALDNSCVLTAEVWIDEVIIPNSPGGPLPCFLQSSAEADVRGTYGSAYDRLVSIKRQYDPTGFFRHVLWPQTEIKSLTNGMNGNCKATDESGEGLGAESL
ncbi:hypothetical protein TREMEDRAFT_73082 [Tremella mesenterica DSM 1558]|uniref:uncharacterized protein n=1 Tax=Tremella mesenterica (strain ATCC 24925 / CBS 8224 / DSM 1558 / NBRC 9311 / NRRL Y-6157 / RJB 2259-6 / UBC 559-6) TaxID=578456 RepID=UPI0003F493A9|nr:uncharacterized protein TREMEDRAFT_73082 [Tremella mesenterica DSM 1558]EIW73493.1 hypothetical protein TREMEDRAFT_73082 [Tremella mesenterica DSM 1558]